MVTEHFRSTLQYQSPIHLSAHEVQHKAIFHAGFHAVFTMKYSLQQYSGRKRVAAFSALREIYSPPFCTQSRPSTYRRATVHIFYDRPSSPSFYPSLLTVAFFCLVFAFFVSA